FSKYGEKIAYRIDWNLYYPRKVVCKDPLPMIIRSWIINLNVSDNIIICISQILIETTFVPDFLIKIGTWLGLPCTSSTIISIRVGNYRRTSSILIGGRKPPSPGTGGSFPSIATISTARHIVSILDNPKRFRITGRTIL